MNNLYPIFIKPENIRILIVGGGFVALEKLTFLYKSSPEAMVTLVSPMIREETLAFIADKICIGIFERPSVGYCHYRR